MHFTEHEAQLASMETMDLPLEQMIDKIDQAIEMAFEISQFGITMDSYNKLQEVYPELSDPEISLSSHPVRLGADNIGNEAIAGLSGGALAALLGALALALGWVASKVFGGGSSGGGGGGLSSKSGSTSKLADARIPFDAGTVVRLYEQNASAYSTAKDKDTAKRKAGKARIAGYIVDRCVDGSLSADIKAMRSLVKDIVELSDGDTADAEINKVIGTFLPSYLNPIIKKLPYLNDKQKSNAEIASIQSIDTLGQSRKKEKAALASALAINYSALTFKPADETKVSPAQFGSTEKAVKDFQKELESMQKSLKGDTSSKKLSLHISASYQGLGILLVWVRNDLIKRLADADEVLTGYVDQIRKTSTMVLSLVTALNDEDKKKVLDAVGVTEDEVKTILAAITKGDLSKCESAIELAEVLEKNIKLSPENKRKLQEALLLKDIF